MPATAMLGRLEFYIPGQRTAKSCAIVDHFEQISPAGMAHRWTVVLFYTIGLITRLARVNLALRMQHCSDYALSATQIYPSVCYRCAESAVVPPPMFG